MSTKIIMIHYVIYWLEILRNTKHTASIPYLAISENDLHNLLVIHSTGSIVGYVLLELSTHYGE